MSAPSWAEPYLDVINGSGFWFKDYISYTRTWNGQTVSALNGHIPTDVSWFTDNTIPTSPQNFWVYADVIFAVNVTTDGTTYSVNFSKTLNASSGLFKDTTAQAGKFGNPTNKAQPITSMLYIGTDQGENRTINFSYSGSGESCFSYIRQHFRNVDIVVNGDYWSRVTPVLYNWQSVPSISGKNGILNLAQIKAESINDGEPVDNASTLDFDTFGDVNIPAIIDEQMPVDPSNPTSVTITYLIPVLTYGSYSYIKLAIKKNNIPLSLEDADRVIDLDEPTTITRIGSATVSGLDELSSYYFVIFIEDDLGGVVTSEPKDIVTGESIVPPQ